MTNVSGPYNIKTPPFGTIPRTQKFFGATAQTAASGTYTIITAELIAVPFYLPWQTSFDQILVETTTAAGTTGKLRLGIYKDNGGVPGALVLDVGTLNEIDLTAATGVKAVTISQALGPGVWWLAYVAAFTGTTPVLRGFAASLQTPSFLGWNTNAPTGSAGRDVAYGDVTSPAWASGTALPDPYTASPGPASPTAGKGAGAPKILLRVA